MGEDFDCCDACRRNGEGTAEPDLSRGELRGGVTLVLENAHERREIVPGKRVMTVGRASGNDIVIAGDANVSKRHCQLSFEDGCVFIVDRGSACGTFVDGYKIRGDFELREGSVIELGDSRLRITSIR